MFSRISTHASLGKVLISVAYLTFSPSSPIYVESHSLVRLDYICTEPDPVPGERNVPVIMMHAVLDVKETWNGIYENVSVLTNRKVCIYDARNHGGSSWNDTCTIDATVEDLESFIEVMKFDRVVLVGHSLGGQTAMKFALSNPSKVEGIFVEDIGPTTPSGVEEMVGYILRLMERSILTVPEGANETTARETILKYIRKFTGRDPFLSFKKYMPIHVANGTWHWKTNVRALDKVLDDVSSAYTTMDGEFGGKALFIYSGVSVFRVAEQAEDIRKLFPNVKLISVDVKDHFIHFAYPEYLKDLLDFLK